MSVSWTIVLFLCFLISPAYAHSTDKVPPTFLIIKEACPFECCVYRTWQTQMTTTAYSAPRRNSKVIGRFDANSRVEALTGEVHSTPSRFRIKRHRGPYRPGDVLWVYSYFGEGHFKIWFKGEMYTEDLGFSPYGGTGGKRCEASPECWGELDEELNFPWWIKIKSAEGWIGWTDQPENFSGKDLCG